MEKSSKEDIQKRWTQMKASCAYPHWVSV